MSVTHQSWGAMLGGDEAQRSRIVAWREGLGLAGVLLASIAPVALDLPAMIAIFWIALIIGWLAWRSATPPTLQRVAATQSSGKNTDQQNLWLPFHRPAFRSLITIFMLNGIASAVPATLVLFFVQDRLHMVKRIGLARAWLAGMLLAMVVFVWATRLGAGDTTAFIVVCALSGIALGADLALPGALLAGVILDAGDRGRAEGAYFGWWNFATKLNLALAAGLALPLLGLFGYAPGARDPAALQALTVAYCVLPCLLKLAASVALYFLIIRPANTPALAGTTP